MDYKNMTNEEIEKEYNRQMMTDYLRQRKAQKIKARVMLIGLGVIFLLMAVMLIAAITSLHPIDFSDLDTTSLYN